MTCNAKNSQYILVLVHQPLLPECPYSYARLSNSHALSLLWLLTARLQECLRWRISVGLTSPQHNTGPVTIRLLLIQRASMLVVIVLGGGT